MRIDEAQLEQSIINLIKVKDRGLETTEILKETGSDIIEIREALQRLKKEGKLDSRTIGKYDFWYALSWTQPKNILVVEDDKNIAKLLKLSVGKEYNVKEVFDGESALKIIPEFKPDLIMLDLMLPGIDGLEVCKKIKQDPQTKNIIVIIVSAADAAVNRFFGIKNGADYYVKKPFEPSEIRALTNIFLKKAGGQFDPLIDIPDVPRLMSQIKDKLNQKEIEFTKVDIEQLQAYQEEYGKKEVRIIVRLVSQMLQDKIKESEEDAIIAYLGDNAFLVAATEGMADKLIQEVEADFKRIAGFIKQKHDRTGDLFEKLKRGKEGGETFSLTLSHYTINIPAFKEHFERESRQIESKLNESSELNVAAVQNYSLDQIRSLFEQTKLDLDVSIKEVGGHVRITAGRKRG